MADDPWLKEFRELHTRAGKGTLSAEERRIYLAAREQLAHTLTKVQGLTQKPGESARQAFRVALAMPLELTLSSGVVRAMTLDVGRGGFASVLQALPGSEPVGFQIKLPGGVMPVTGRSRVVDSRKQVGNFRVAFAFVDLGEPDVDRIERALFDSVLARIG